MNIVTAEEMRAIDRVTTEKHGVPSLTLMENAGTAVAEFAQKHFDFNSVCAVCGRGNNGGDGFVAARKLHEAGKKVSLIVLAKSAEDLRGDAAEMFKKLPLQPLWVGEEGDFGKADVQQALTAELIVDAILGTGFKPPIQGIAMRAVELVNNAGAPVLAVDLPSGADADSAEPVKHDVLVVRADAVVTFTAPKLVHVFGETTKGPAAVAAIGSPPELIFQQSKLQQNVITFRELAQGFLERASNAHKGTFGHVLVIGGSVGKAGAAAMAALAALRSGAGLVTVACPKSVQTTVAAFAPEIMTEPLPETSEGTISLEALPRLHEVISGKGCLAVGPGLSRNQETAEVVRQLVTRPSLQVVLDADGINAFQGHLDLLKPGGDLASQVFPRRLVLTPHPGELGGLLGISPHEVQRDRLSLATGFAREYAVTVVLKGHRTLTASPKGEVFVNLTGNPGMAKGGSGDVLTGILAALLAPWHGMIGMKSASKEEDAEIRELFRQRIENPSRETAMALFQKTRPLMANTYSVLLSNVSALAVFLHGLAGDVARDLYGESSMLATDIISSIGQAIAIAHAQDGDKFAYLQR